jgi:basic membrane lipoprotein Med (substrate-binding protein (PBP1-ABC) superfamily)
MTPLPLLRSSSLLARSALLALVLAGCAGTAVSHDAPAPAAAPRVAILAGADASAADVAAAAARAGDGAVVRRAGGTLDAQAQAARLAAEGYDTVVGVGPQARAAVGQAASGEVGADTRWQTADAVTPR